jgi:hypothetical protein
MTTRFPYVGCAVLGFLVGLQPLGHAQSTRQHRQEALRLCGERNAVGATKLRDAYDQEKQPEILFDLGECQERLGQDDGALQTYRAYLKLPLALRLAEANARVAAIESRHAEQVESGSPTSPPRYVLLPNDPAANACSAKCSTTTVCAEPSRKGPTDRMAQNRCFTKEFACLSSCPAARVKKGECPTGPSLRGFRCFDDRTRRALPGLLTPGKF